MKDHNGKKSTTESVKYGKDIFAGSDRLATSEVDGYTFNRILVPTIGTVHENQRSLVILSVRSAED